MKMKSQSCGIEEVSLKIVKATKQIVIPILVYLVNLSLVAGTFPKRLKRKTSQRKVKK